MGTRLARAAAAVLMTAGLMAIAACELRGPSASPGGAGDRLPPNAACYICHMPLMKDTITKTHAKAGITCTRCHGLSAAHANDEKIGATPPDRKFRNGEGIAFCRTCHKTHDVAPEAVVQRYRQRVAAAPAATQPTASIACTQCHGAHRLLRQAATQPTSSEK